MCIGSPWVSIVRDCHDTPFREEAFRREYIIFLVTTHSLFNTQKYFTQYDFIKNLIFLVRQSAVFYRHQVLSRPIGTLKLLSCDS